MTTTANKHTFRRGDIVQYWFDTGAFGCKILYGLVTRAGPKRYGVTWESRLTNRIEQGNPNVKLAEDQVEARAALIQRGVLAA